MVYTNFQDELGVLEEVELAGANNGTVDLPRYKEKMRSIWPNTSNTQPSSASAGTSN